MFQWNLGWGLAGQARYDEAAEACDKARRLLPGEVSSQAFLGWALGLAGRREEALTILKGLEQRRIQEYVSGWMLAIVNVGLGNHEQASSWLQEAADDRDSLMAFVGHSFLFDPLRSDPRFQALLQRMNFPQTPQS